MFNHTLKWISNPVNNVWNEHLNRLSKNPFSRKQFKALQNWCCEISKYVKAAPRWIYLAMQILLAHCLNSNASVVKLIESLRFPSPWNDNCVLMYSSALIKRSEKCAEKIQVENLRVSIRLPCLLQKQIFPSFCSSTNFIFLKIWSSCGIIYSYIKYIYYIYFITYIYIKYILLCYIVPRLRDFSLFHHIDLFIPWWATDEKCIWIIPQPLSLSSSLAASFIINFYILPVCVCDDMGVLSVLCSYVHTHTYPRQHKHTNTNSQTDARKHTESLSKILRFTNLTCTSFLNVWTHIWNDE